MTERCIGGKPPRYKFLLNPHEGLRLSRCPTCNKSTYPRKFALFIHVDGFGPYTQGKTCKYCSRCEMIMCHQLELESELTHAFAMLRPELIGNDYLVIGTMDLKTWKAGLHGEGNKLRDIMLHVADFGKYMTLDYDPGGWGVEGTDRTISHKVASARLVTPWRYGDSSRHH